MRHLSTLAFGLAVLLAAPGVRGEGSKGENYSDKPPAVLFNSDCTGSGCHSGPQGLAKGKSVSALSDYLREHYTNSRQSAAALANYLSGVPGANSARPKINAEPPTRESSKREPPAREEEKKEGSGWPSFPFFSSPSEPEKREEAAPPARSRSAPTRESTKRQPPKREEQKQEENSSVFPFSLFSSPNQSEAAKPDQTPARRTRTGKRNESNPSSEKKKEEAKPATESKRDDAKPSESTKPADNVKPADNAKREETPSRRTRTGKRNETRPLDYKRDETTQSIPQTPSSDVKREETTPHTRPSSSKPEESAKPKTEGDTAKPKQSRARPSHQLPKIEDPNAPTEEQLYRPARPRSEDDSKPPETTVTSTRQTSGSPAAQPREQIYD